MNLFILHEDPCICATYHSDQHMKMCLEAAQLISSAVSVLGKYFPNAAPLLYKPTHYNHPCCKWVRESRENFKWTVELCLALQLEKAYRDGKGYEKCSEVARNAVSHYSHLFPSIPQTPYAIAINTIKYPNVVIDVTNPVQTYRDYYKQGKLKFSKKGEATWRKRGLPEWLLEEKPKL